MLPSIGSFHGIDIYMYYEIHNRYHIPHLHAKYQNNEAEFDFDGNIIQSIIPDKQKNLVAKWIKSNKNQIIIEWTKLQNGEKPDKIEPLP